MARIRTTVLILMLVFASSAIAAPIAMASPQWWVAGSLLTGKAALAEKTNVTKPLKVEFSGVTFECKKVKIKEGFIESPSSRKEAAEIFEECQVNVSNCSVGTTETRPLQATLEEVKAGEIKLKFSPQTGTEVATVQITGGSCVIKGSYTLTGTMVCEYKGVETESTEHPLEFTPTSGSKVEVNEKPAKFSGTDKVSLASGANWSAR